MRKLLRLSTLVALCLAAPARAAETSIACDGGIVRLGDTKLDLLGKCGPPALEDARQIDTTRFGAGGSVVVRDQMIQEWSYNFGPQRFVMHVTLERGKVVAIQRGSYGYDPDRLKAPPEGRPRCEPAALRVGDAKIDLVAKCGPPTLQERGDVRPPTVVTSPSRVGAAVEVETWTYDFGPRQFVRIVTLENGRVVSVDTGSFGYAR